MAKRKRVWNVDVIQQEGDFQINRGYKGWATKALAERWLDRELKSRATPDRFGNYPYGGDGKGGPVEVVSTRVYSVWEAPEPPIYILDY